MSNKHRIELVNRLAIDFDGVLMHRVASRDQHKGCVGLPIKGARIAVEALHKDWVLVVHTCRAATPEGILDVWRWLRKYGMHDYFAEVTNIKPMAAAYIDDRAVRFDNWEMIKQVYEVRDE